MRAFCHSPNETKIAPSNAVQVPTRNASRQNGKNQAGIDRVTHHPVRAGVDDAMIFFVRNGIRPITPQMDAPPPGERDAHQHHDGHEIGAGVTKVVERFRSQLRGEPR